MVTRQPHLCGCLALLGRQNTTMCRSVSGKVWETEGSSPREAMTATQQSSAVVLESHQLLLVSVVGEGTVQVTQAGTRRKQRGTRKFRGENRQGPHSCVLRAAQTQLCKGPFPGNPWEGLSSLAGPDSPRVKASLDQSSQLSDDVMSGPPAQGCLDLDKHHQHSPGWQQSHQAHQKSKHRDVSLLDISTLSTQTAHYVTSAD